MTKQYGILFTCLSLLLASAASAEATTAANEQAPALPAWQTLEFQEKAYWATASSTLEVLPDPEDETLWRFAALSSIVNNTEQMDIVFEPDTGRVLSRDRLSRGSNQRIKSYRYKDDFILRERRNQPSDPGLPPAEWPVSSTQEIPYPAAAADTVVTSPYLLILLAQRLQAQGPDRSREVLVHTDRNFYRVKMTSGRGIPVAADYEISGKGNVRGERKTVAVSIQPAPEGELADDDDFSLLGLNGNIIIFFDSESRLPVQVRGQAPRIGETAINLKSVTMRPANK
jgi:hypothetical protein